MLDVIEVIRKAYSFYVENYRTVFSAFVVVAVIEFISIIVSRLSDFYSRVVGRVCEQSIFLYFSESFNVTCETAEFVSILLVLVNLVVSLATGFIYTVIILAVLKNLNELIEGSQASSWQSNLRSQVGNTLRLWLLSFLQSVFAFIFVFVPVILLLFLGALFIKTPDPVFFIALIALAIVLVFLISVIFLLFFTFVQVELVLTHRGLIEAVRNSYRIVRSHLSEVIVFHLFWIAVGVVSFITILITCCLSIFVAPILNNLLILPVRLCSEIMLWKRLKPEA